MPFTFAHPAIVLPFLKKGGKWSATGLILGSIAPDFESFLKFGEDKIFGHTWLGLFWFDIPLAYLLIFVFQVLIKEPFVDRLPMELRCRLQPFRTLNWGTYHRKHRIVVLYSVVVGLFSHLLWDAFTHLNLSYPDAITSKISIQGHRVYIILQYLCTLIGQALVVLHFLRLPTGGAASITKKNWQFWSIHMAIAGIIFAIVFSIYWQNVGLLDPIYIINLAISALFYALLVVAIADKYLVNPRLYFDENVH